MSVKFHRGFRALRGATTLPLCLFAAFAATPSFAADATATGVDASFIALLGDLNGMLGGNFGALLLLVSLIIAVAVYAVTSNIRWVVASLAVAFLIGYGVDIISGIGGVTATVDLLVAPLDSTDAAAAVVAEPQLGSDLG